LSANHLSDDVAYTLSIRKFFVEVAYGPTCMVNTLSIPILRAQFTNHAIPKYLHLLGILVFKVFN
jgi:hypothetical protein